MPSGPATFLARPSAHRRRCRAPPAGGVARAPRPARGPSRRRGRERTTRACRSDPPAWHAGIVGCSRRLIRPPLPITLVNTCPYSHAQSHPPPSPGQIAGLRHGHGRADPATRGPEGRSAGLGEARGGSDHEVRREFESLSAAGRVRIQGARFAGPVVFSQFREVSVLVRRLGIPPDRWPGPGDLPAMRRCTAVARPTTCRDPPSL